jgi:septal ring factor EnvC (AmiA/AmiB activator)
MEQLKGQESQLMKSIEKNREVEQRVDRYIKIVIQNEIAKAQKEAEEKMKAQEAAEKKKLAEQAKANAAEKKPAEHPQASAPEAPVARAPKPESVPLLSTPTDIALANNFEGNKGKMYWPVERGYISDHFGVHPHPLAPKVMIENYGIDIQTTPDATAKAVFEGTVTSVSTVENMMVLIRHGDYMTVYNNLKSVSVTKGQHVNTNQPIGVVANNDEGEPTLKFQIWKMGKKAIKLNPEQWLGKLH